VNFPDTLETGMARERATVVKELLESEKVISTLIRRLDVERAHFRALAAELQSPEHSAPIGRRTPEANMMDSVSRIVHRCRAAKITAEQAREVAILQLSTMACERYKMTEIPQIVRDRVVYEVAQFWGADSTLQ
jgi:hypothetical protein